MDKSRGIVHLFVIISLVCVVGCYTFDNAEIVVRIDQTQIECEGPGMEDGVACRLEKCEYKIDDGSRISIGLFPGMHRCNYMAGKNDGAGHVAEAISSNFGSTANCRHIASERRGDPA